MDRCQPQKKPSQASQLVSWLPKPGASVAVELAVTMLFNVIPVSVVSWEAQADHIEYLKVRN